MLRYLKISLVVLLMFNSFTSNAQVFKSKKGSKSKEITEREMIQSVNYFVDGQKYYMLEDFTKALVLFEKSLEINPYNDAAYFKIGQIHLKNGDYDEALGYSIQALELKPNNKFYYSLAADVYTSQSNFAKAAEIFEEMISNIEGTESSLFDLAALYLYSQQYEKALSTYERVEKEFGMIEEVIQQKQKIYLKINDLEGAIREGEKLVENNPASSRYKLAMAELLFTNDRETEAIPYLEKVLEEQPKEAKARIMLAEIYQKSGEIEKAREHLIVAFSRPELSIKAKLQTMAGYIQQLPDPDAEAFLFELADNLVKAHPKESNAYAIYGDFLFQLKQEEKALEKYLEAIEYDESNFSIWQNILSIEMNLQRYGEVIEHGEMALEVFPNQASLYYFTGTAYLIKKKHRQAVQVLEQGKKMAGSNRELMSVFNSQLGDAYNGIGDHEKSDAYYEAVLQDDPDNSHALNNYSYFLSLRKEKLDKAKKMSTRLVKMHPNNPTFLDTHAWVLYMLGEYKESKKHLERALEHDKSNGTIIEHYGDVLFKLGETDRAVKEWERAKGLNDSSDLIDKKIADRKLYE